MKKRKNKKGFLIGGIAAGAVVILAGGGILAWKLLINTATPQETVKNYFALVEKGQYDKMFHASFSCTDCCSFSTVCTGF